MDYQTAFSILEVRELSVVRMGYQTAFSILEVRKLSGQNGLPDSLHHTGGRGAVCGQNGLPDNLQHTGGKGAVWSEWATRQPSAFMIFPA